MSVQGLCDAGFRVASAFSALSSTQATHLALFVGGATIAVALNATYKYEDTTEKVARIAFTAFLGGLCPFALLAAGELFLNATAFTLENPFAAVDAAVKTVMTSTFQALQFLNSITH